MAVCVLRHIERRPSEKPIVIASAAKQSMNRKERMDCFAEPVIGRAFARPVGSQ
jgi:hypothetical protein